MNKSKLRGRVDVGDRALTVQELSLLRQISEDRATGSTFLFGHRHPQATPSFHIQIMDLWRSAEEFVVIEAFREAGKSTLSEEFLLMEACFGNFRYALIFGETYTKACQRLTAIKHEALRNDRLISLFGNLKGETWGVDTIQLKNGVRLEAHGWEEEIRGYKHLDARPDRAYLDDIENKSMVRDTAAVDATWRKLNTELIPALDKDRRKIRVTGTPLADDCMITRCNKSPEWITAKFPICAVSGVEGAECIDHPGVFAMWPQRYPMEWIRKERDRFASAGLLREFIQEYMLIAAQTQGKPFVAEQIRSMDLAPNVWCPKILIMDPARTSHKKSDRTGRLVVSRLGTTIYVHESSGEYWKPDAIISDAFETSHKYDDCEVAIERNSLDDFLMQPMRAEMLRRGRTLNMQAMLAPSDRSKEEFILGLQPAFIAGDIVLVGGESKHAQLWQEIVNFPSGKRDILNCLAYTQRVFGGAPIYPEFGPENIVRMYEPERDDKLCVVFHATTSETCGVLVGMRGRSLTIMADWASSLSCMDAVRDMLTLVHAAYPGHRFTTWVSADVYDQQGRVVLTDTLRNLKIAFHRGGFISQTRGILSDYIRTTFNGRRLLTVDITAKNTLNALSGGYRQAVRPDGRPSGEPEQNVSRTIGQALEILTSGIEQGRTAEALPDGYGKAVNAQGVPYFSALKR